MRAALFLFSLEDCVSGISFVNLIEFDVLVEVSRKCYSSRENVHLNQGCDVADSRDKEI